MLAELFQAVVGVSQEAREKKFEVKDFPNNPDRKLLVVDGVEKVLDTPRQAPDPNSQVASIADLAAAYIRKFGDEKVDGEKHPEIWYTIKGAMYFQDEPFRRQSVAVLFRETAVWTTVRQLKAPKVFQHEALVRLLRHDLAPCGVRAVLDAFRTMNYEARETANRTIKHAHQSMDSDLVATAKTGGIDTPEQFQLSLKPFADLELNFLNVSMIVTIDVDAQNRAVTLQLMPDEVERVEIEMRKVVRDKLAMEMPEGTVLLAGTP